MTETSRPKLAELVRQGDAQTEADAIADFIFGVRDISNAYLVTTDAGDVMVNTGFMDNAERNQALLAPHRTGALSRIILTQSHADHFGGLDVFREEGTEILAGPGYWRNWQEMKRLQPFFAPRSRKLWGATLKRGGAPQPPPEVRPDTEVVDGYGFELGGRTFEILHTPEGEATDGITVWMPDERVAFVGNLCGPVWLSMPFLNTLRGDKPRSVRQYLASIIRVRDLNAELLITGHGEPIRGAEQIRADFDRLHAAVSFVRDETLDGMNAGKSLEQLMSEIALPDELSIGEHHGKVSWAVKAIWYEYTGWFHYNSTTELYGVPQSAIHSDILEAVGGPEPLVQKARAHIDGGRLLEAIHLLDIVLGSQPEHRAGLEAKAAAVRGLLDQVEGENLSETMWLRSELSETNERLGVSE